MCGIVGFLDQSGFQSVGFGGTLSRMMDAVAHRGPDDSGFWLDADTGLALGHRRLAVVDLSPQGSQPMISASGRYVLAFNGEIYNHRQLKQQLESLSGNVLAQSMAGRWKGHSDTEVMLAGFEHWGVDRALAAFNGMFSFVLYDRHDRVLYFARDRFGEKPLYYGWIGDVFLFGSELKALRAHPKWRGTIDRDSVALYVRHTYIPAPFSIYKGIRKLLPAHVLRLSVAKGKQERLEPRAYWSLSSTIQECRKQPFVGRPLEAVETLDRTLRDAVKLRMEADVPLGAFLSGGIDSSTVVALMQAESARPIKTFTIGFHEQAFNEAKLARAIAQRLGTDHTEMYVSEEDALSVIPLLPAIYDEPFADSSQIPTYLISKMTRQHVTVALSGDAGDELFAGYDRYVRGSDIWRKMGWVPPMLRSCLARGIRGVPPRWLEFALGALRQLLPHDARAGLSGEKARKLAEALARPSAASLYRQLVSYWEPGSIVLGGMEPPTVLTDAGSGADIPEFVDRMMFFDAMSYLPDDILVKVDRASMAVSLETRVPLLDHRVVEFAWRLPVTMKIRDGKTKWPVREVLKGYLPEELFERPKMGFGVPLASWLRGSLRAWAEHLLDESRLRSEGFFDPAIVRQRWQEHLTGTRNWHYHLWIVLMFGAWLEKA